MIRKLIRFLRWLDRITRLPRTGVPKPKPIWNRQGSFRL
jgi:hypothetical protein